jgi:capsule polysaccharide export protein KpsC/LpsZ
MGYVYLLLSVDIHSFELYKIGISKNDPLLRVKSLQTGNGDKIDVLKTYKTSNYKKLEKMLHFKFSPFKTEVNNEWFNLPHTEVINFINTCEKLDSTINSLKDNPFFK